MRQRSMCIGVEFKYVFLIYRSSYTVRSIGEGTVPTVVGISFSPNERGWTEYLDRKRENKWNNRKDEK